MRIIAGDLRGMRLKTLPGESTRPTLERVKEAMFSSVHFFLPGACVLDLFAGSGQLGLEALSRGAEHCVFVDQGRAAVDVIQANLRALGLEDRSRVVYTEADAFLARSRDRFDLVFLDPPYQQDVFPGILARVAPAVADEGILLCESEPGLAFPEEVAGLVLAKQYKYGTVQVTRYRKETV